VYLKNKRDYVGSQISPISFINNLPLKDSPIMKRALVIDNNYPNEDNKYGDVFVHVRVKEYQKELDVSIVGLNRKLPETFEYEGVQVRNFRDKKSFIEYIIANNPDILLIHFLEFWMIDPIVKKLNKPTIIWVHGHEVIKWYRRLFNFSLSPSFIKYMLRTEIQSIYWNRLIHFANSNSHIHFVFVSEWMKDIAEKDSSAKIQSYSIIPNPIDVDLFPYNEKPFELRKNILLLRSFDSRKYANDLAIKGIIKLSQLPEFKDFQFGIFGMGKEFDPLTMPLRGFPNVQLHKSFIEHKEIPLIHKEYGVFLCPTRQDAQGVSMCEAMSSGLVPITSYNTAIPEFVNDHQTGLFANSPQDIANSILELYTNQALFQYLSNNASRAIVSKCNLQTIISKELSLINK
jgi:L-malate glycosyltransferase